MLIHMPMPSWPTPCFQPHLLPAPAMLKLNQDGQLVRLPLPRPPIGQPPTSGACSHMEGLGRREKEEQSTHPSSTSILPPQGPLLAGAASTAPPLPTSSSTLLLLTTTQPPGVPAPEGAPPTQTPIPTSNSTCLRPILLHYSRWPLPHQPVRAPSSFLPGGPTSPNSRWGATFPFLPGGKLPPQPVGGHFPLPDWGAQFPQQPVAGNFPLPAWGANFPHQPVGGHFPLHAWGANFHNPLRLLRLLLRVPLPACRRASRSYTGPHIPPHHHQCWSLHAPPLQRQAVTPRLLRLLPRVPLPGAMPSSRPACRQASWSYTGPHILPPRHQRSIHLRLVLPMMWCHIDLGSANCNAQACTSPT